MFVYVTNKALELELELELEVCVHWAVRLNRVDSATFCPPLFLKV